MTKMKPGFDVDILRARLKDQPTKRRLARNPYQPPVLDDFALGAVLALDQTLTKTGWAYVVRDLKGLHVPVGGLLVPDIDDRLRGFEGTYAKAAALEELLISKVVIPHLFLAAKPPEAVVHEMPSVRGHRTESSLLAGREVRRVVGGRTMVMMINRRSAYATLVGSPDAEKAEGTKTVNRLIPKERRKTTSWNQDVHDAVILALKYLYEKKRRSS